MARQAHVALVRIAKLGAAALDATRKQLGPRDRRRLAAFRSARRRREFLAGRWLLGQSSRAWRSAAIRFDASPQGGVEASTKRVAASVSHAGGWVACALVERGSVGVDLEPMVPRDFAAAGRWAFDVPTDSPRDFYGRWTRYEARLKARRERDAGYTDVTYYLGGIALSVCVPSRTVVRGSQRLAGKRK